MLVSCIGSMLADDYVPDMTKAMSITVNDLDKDEFTVKGNQYTVTSAVVDGKSFSATFNNETAGGWTTSRNDYVANPEGKAINFNIRAQLKKNTTVSLQFPCKGYLYVYGYGFDSDITLYTGKIGNQTIQVTSTKESMPTAEDASTTVKGYTTQKFIALKGSATLYVDYQNSMYFYGFCFVPDENIELETKPYAAYNDGTLTFLYDDKWGDEEGTFLVSSGGYWDRQGVSKTTTKVVFDPSFASYTELESTSSWFLNFTKLETVTGLENLNTQNVTSMSQMFYGCTSLTSIDTDKLNTENVTSMGYMFYNCSGLTTLDVSNFDTQNVASMNYMFYGCSGLQSLDVSNFDTQNVTSMGHMFYGCSGLQTLDVSKFNTQKVTSIASMFYGCSGLSLLDLRSFSTESLKEATDLYAACKDDLIVLLPEGWNVDAMTRIASLEPVGNFLYNIYKDHHAILSYRKESVSISGDMVVPGKIEYQGEEYKVTKVGMISFAAETPERNLFTILSDEEYLKVTSITFEDGIEEINDSHLGMYVHAASINIPKSVKNISPATYRQQSVRNFLYVDENGRFLSDVTFNVDKDNPVYTSIDGVLYDKDMKTLLRCPRNKTGEFVVPEGVEALAWSAFRSCGQLESVVLPVGLKTVGEENATSGVFNECYKLAKINIPSTVEYMSYQAFYTNSSSGLKEIFCYITEPKGYDEEAMNLFRDYSRPTLYVPFGTKEKYLAAEGWKNFENIVEMPEPTAIDAISSNDTNVISGKIYYIDGKQLSQPQNGINVIKMSDGTMRKVAR